MSDLIDRQAAIEVLDEIRHALWEIDIPSPTVPEYVEHHEQVQSVWKLLDKKQKELYLLPSAQPEQTDCEYCHEDSDGYVRPIEKNSHAWFVRHGKTMKLRVSFKGEHRDCDIKFCPMCGRRLTDG